MQDRAPGLYRSYLATLGVAGSGLLAVATTQLVDTGPVSLTMVLGFLAAGFTVEVALARVRRDLGVSLITVVLFTAILTGGAPLAVVTTPAAALATFVRAADRRVARAVFNGGQYAIAAFLAGHAFVALGGQPGEVARVVSAHGLGALLLTSVIFTVVNTTLIVVVLYLTRGEPVVSNALTLLGSTSMLQALYVGLSVVAAALLLTVHPVALLLLLVPALVARSGLLGFQEETEAYDRLVRSFVKAIEVKDGYTRGHAERVALLAEEVAAELGLDYEHQRAARFGALLHDIGKIGVPLSIINKPGPLTDQEFDLIRRHPEVGADMLRDIDFLRSAVEVIRFHHERIDGRGYPYGVTGDAVPLLARVVTVVDAFDAMTSTRSYRRAFDVERALAELRRCRGTQFEPAAVDALEIVATRLRWQPTFSDGDQDLTCQGETIAMASELSG